MHAGEGGIDGLHVRVCGFCGAAPFMAVCAELIAPPSLFIRFMFSSFASLIGDGRNSLFECVNDPILHHSNSPHRMCVMTRDDSLGRNDP